LKKFFTREMLERDGVRDAETGNQGEAGVQEGEALEEDEAVGSAEGEVFGIEDDEVRRILSGQKKKGGLN
jgi:hypothetical protein